MNEQPVDQKGMWAYYIPNVGLVAFGSEAQIKQYAMDYFQKMIQMYSMMHNTQEIGDNNYQQVE